MKKKSIVLLITLFFISAISILILQNLKDTDDFLDEISFDTSLAQVQITIDNVNQEIPSFLKKNKDNLEEILESSEIIPLRYGSVNLILNILEYDVPLFNINKLTPKQTSSEEFINNINYQYDFLELINKRKKDYGSFKNNKQIRQTIKEYMQLTKDNDILNIQDKFTYLNIDTNLTLYRCEYSIKVNSINSKVSFLFDLNSSKIQDFSIKGIF